MWVLALTACRSFETARDADYLPLDPGRVTEFKSSSGKRGTLSIDMSKTAGLREIRFSGDDELTLVVSIGWEGIVMHEIRTAKGDTKLNAPIVLVPAEIVPRKPWHSEAQGVSVDASPEDQDTLSGGRRFAARRLEIRAGGSTWLLWLGLGAGIVRYQGTAGPIQDVWEIGQMRR
jgi:hypothetical protein